MTLSMSPYSFYWQESGEFLKNTRKLFEKRDTVSYNKSIRKEERSNVSDAVKRVPEGGSGTRQETRRKARSGTFPALRVRGHSNVN